jgi:hypothetical protein
MQGQSVQLTIISDSSEKGVGRSLRLGLLTFGLAAAFGRALSQQKEITDASFSAKSASHALDEDFDPIAGSNQPSNEGLQTLEWAFSNPDALSRLEQAGCCDMFPLGMRL